MNAQAWVGLAGVIATCAGGIALFIFKFGNDLGAIKAGVAELLGRDERTNKRVDTIALRLNDHMERIARLEGGRE